MVRAEIEDGVKPGSDIAAERVALLAADAEICSAPTRLGEAVLVVVIVFDPDARFEGDDAGMKHGADARDDGAPARDARPNPAQRRKRAGTRQRSVPPATLRLDGVGARPPSSALPS